MKIFCKLPDRAIFKPESAFSLVEMLMALLVASLLLAALAPVMTRKMNESLYVSGEFAHKGKSEIVDITFGGPYCNKITTDDNGNPLYCEGDYVVPDGYSNITVTAIGAGGGGGTAPTAGYTEYKEAGSTNTFTVPAMVNKLEATFISGGAGGGAGGQVEAFQEWKTGGSFWWSIPDVLKNKYGLITACGGGGGGGGNSTYAGGGGGSGGYIGQLSDDKRPLLFPSYNIEIIIGGGGGGGGGDNLPGNNGGSWLGGGGGSGIDYTTSPDGTGGKLAGLGGRCLEDRGGTGGLSGTGCGGHGMNGINPETLTVLQDVIILGGGGCYGGGKGGDAPAASSAHGIPESGPGGGGGGGASQAGGGGGGAGAGSGGGGGAATLIGGYGSYNNISLIASGGGGGGGGGGEPDRALNQGGGGGGGGGTGGGSGGNAGGLPFSSLNGYPGFGGLGGNPGVGTVGGQVSTIFGNNNCSGGNGNILYQNGVAGQNGKPGAMRITYLAHGPGGGGGASGTVIGLNHQSVEPNESLSVIIGSTANGGTPGKIDQNGNIISPTHGTHSRMSFLKRGNTVLQQTGGNTDTLCGWSGCGGDAGGQCAGTYCHSGHVVTHWAPDNISGGSEIYTPALAKNPELPGFSATGGYSAGNKAAGNYSGKLTSEDGGGDGGIVTTPWFECTPGKGGTKENPVGGNATGFGCGGGGGYGLSDGGKGSGGYARISWNMYWNVALNDGSGGYSYSTLGAGGGGASGNAIKETIKVSNKQIISIRIGAGGIGAKVVNGVLVPATDGGTTIFGDNSFIEIKAGGGGGGISPYQNGNNIKGEGGKPSNVCKVGSRDYHNNANRCTKGKDGNAPDDDSTNAPIGGSGAQFAYTVDKVTYQGQGGGGGMQAREKENSQGKNGEGTGAGGGGSALLIYDRVENSTQLSHPQGGNGANGRIILQLWE